jgi:hypothetical protein
MGRRSELNALARRLRGIGYPWGQQRDQEAGCEAKEGQVSATRPGFRVELKVRVRKADGLQSMVWMAMPEIFAGQDVECALEEAVEAACNEVRRIAKRPKYDLVDVLGADYHVMNVRFVRTDLEDEDG